jgi:hypothetical protein
MQPLLQENPESALNFNSNLRDLLQLFRARLKLGMATISSPFVGIRQKKARSKEEFSLHY